MFIVPAGTSLMQCKRPRFGEGHPSGLGPANDSCGAGFKVRPEDAERVEALIRATIEAIKGVKVHIDRRSNYLAISLKETNLSKGAAIDFLNKELTKVAEALGPPYIKAQACA